MLLTVSNLQPTPLYQAFSNQFQMKQIKNLVFQGGGVKGLAYVGALQQLQSRGMLDQIEGVAGTSAGSIVSTLLSVRYSAEAITETMRNTNMASFKDREGIFRRIKYFGMHPGDAFLKWIKQQIRNSPLGLKDTATFKDFQEKGARDLHVFATDLFTHNIRRFSIETTPNVVVAEAIRASMSIPVFFNAWRFTNNNPDDHIYVDGGVLLNFPLYTFDELNHPPDETLGFELVNQTGTPVLNKFGYWEWGEFVKNTFDTLLLAQDVVLSQEETERARIVSINDFGISATDFNLTEQQKKELIQSGWDATKAFFDKK